MGANSASLLWRGKNGVKCCRYPFYRYKRQHHLILTFRNNLSLRTVIGRSVASSLLRSSSGIWDASKKNEKTFQEAKHPARSSQRTRACASLVQNSQRGKLWDSRRELSLRCQRN